jgi:hypothetical protein
MEPGPGDLRLPGSVQIDKTTGSLIASLANMEISILMDRSGLATSRSSWTTGATRARRSATSIKMAPLVRRWL